MSESREIDFMEAMGWTQSLSEQDIEKLYQQPSNDILQLPAEEKPTENQITYIHTQHEH